MPTYSYHCDACDADFEKEQRITEAPIKKCPACGKLKARRMISGGNFILKGGGWYADAYGLKPGKSSSGESSSSGSSTSSKDSAKASAKPSVDTSAATTGSTDKSGTTN